MDAVTLEIAATVRAELARRGLRQVDLGRHLGIPQAAVSRRLCGQVPWDVAELAAAAEFLGLPLAALLPEAASAGAA